LPRLTTIRPLNTPLDRNRGGTRHRSAAAGSSRAMPRKASTRSAAPGAGTPGHRRVSSPPESPATRISPAARRSEETRRTAPGSGRAQDAGPTVVVEAAEEAQRRGPVAGERERHPAGEAHTCGRQGSAPRTRRRRPGHEAARRRPRASAAASRPCRGSRAGAPVRVRPPTACQGGPGRTRAHRRRRGPATNGRVAGSGACGVVTACGEVGQCAGQVGVGELEALGQQAGGCGAASGQCQRRVGAQQQRPEARQDGRRRRCR